MTKASNVPMLTSSPRMPIGISDAKIATKMPTVMLVIQGVRKRGCTAPAQLGQKAVARHGEEHAGLPQQHDQHHAAQAGNRAELHEDAAPAHAGVIDADGHRIGDVQCGVRHNAGEKAGNENIEDGADHQRTENADGHIPLRIFRFLRGGGNRVESDVGEENDRRLRARFPTNRNARMLRYSVG